MKNFQKAINFVSKQGILLAICSKNNEKDVLEVFENHKSMQIKKNIQVAVNNINFSNSNRLVLISGPCAIESLDHAVNMTGIIKDICDSLRIDFVYKSSSILCIFLKYVLLKYFLRGDF